MIRCRNTASVTQLLYRLDDSKSLWLVCLWALCWLNGCSTHAKRLYAPRQHFFSNNLPAAHEDLSKLSQKKPGDRTVAELDLAVIELLQGKADSAEQRLRQVRDQWEELEQKSLTEDAQALLTDDQKRQYAGETYEKLLIGVFLTMASLMQDAVDAEAYSLQTLMKQQQLVDSLNSQRDEPVTDLFGIPPIAPYLRGVMREATLHDYDDALRMYQLTAAMLPEHPQLISDIQRVDQSTHSPPGHGVVYVMALVGRGPHKVEQAEPVTQAVLFQADRIVSVFGKYSVPPTLAPIKIPKVQCPPKQIDAIGVEINSSPFATTLTITDLEQLARETYAEQLPGIMARTVARRVVKKGAVYAAKHQMKANAAASLALDVAGVAWEATESADTRCWGLLPREIQILRIELPAGMHQLALQPVVAGRPVGEKSYCDVEVIDARNTYILGCWPDSNPVGRILVNTP